ncbi:MAG: RNA polymerase factor sigma-54 [Ignavibacteriales bacterium]
MGRLMTGDWLQMKFDGVTDMRLGHDLHLEQQQKLLMTPELRQAIAILQMSSLELSEYLEQELQENPVLEIREEAEPQEATDSEVKDSEADQAAEVDWSEYFLDRSDLGYAQKTDPNEQERNYENYLTLAPTLHEHLQFQMHISINNEADQRIGQFLIGSIDENGYLRIDTAEVAQTLEVPESQVLSVLRIIQTFEPYGVGARDLSECLMIQLNQSGQITPEIEQIVLSYLEDLGRGRMAKIASALGMNVLEVQRIADLIKSLDPKPGRQYASGEEVRYLVPDITVEKINGEYVVMVNDGNSPRLVISQMYQEVLRQPDAFGQDAKKYLEDRMNSAVWLIKSIEHRRLTLYKTAKCIVEIQHEFLDNGVMYLKPLNLKQVADVVGVHESTISRATANKYIQTPQGVFEMKYFFCGGVSSTDGDEMVSSRSIKRILKELIMEEDTSSPWSDQHISEIMQSRGINISRRTVAKYRTELGIEATNKRKRY